MQVIKPDYFLKVDRILELHKNGLDWHSATVRGTREYLVQFECCAKSESVTTPGFNHDGHHEPTTL